MASHGCTGCGERDAVIAALQQQVRVLEARVRDLEARLNQHAGNSSLPPSANPPGAPPPVTKAPTGRKPGGQPGHLGHLRLRLPPERVQEVVLYVPTHCDRCQAPLPAQADPDDNEPTWQQVIELPELRVAVTEHQAHSRTCTWCGTVTRAVLPAAVRAHGVGPRLTAVLAYLTGRYRLSKRDAAELVGDLLGVPLSLGTVAHLEQEVSQALAGAHAAAGQAVQAAPVKYADETGWKRAGQLHWLWAAATQTVAYFLVQARRSGACLTALLGTTVRGIVCSDRWSAYGRLPLAQRQICWAHLKRDFQKCVDRGEPAAAIGQVGLAAVADLFQAWHLFRGGGRDRARLQRSLAPVRRAVQAVLTAGCACADAKAATFCRNVLDLYPALWTFVTSAGVEPTNNHAERVLRRGVLWRKTSFGCQSEGGCRFVERILTVVQTLRLQGRNVLSYLYETLLAHRAALPLPALLVSG